MHKLPHHLAMYIFEVVAYSFLLVVVKLTKNLQNQYSLQLFQLVSRLSQQRFIFSLKRICDKSSFGV